MASCLSSNCAADLDVLGSQLRLEFKEISVKRGLNHDFLGMTLDFSQPGAVKITMDKYIDDLVCTPGVTQMARTPAAAGLFDVDASSPALDKDTRKWSHSMAARLLYLGIRARREILVAVAFLTSHVQVATSLRKILPDS